LYAGQAGADESTAIKPNSGEHTMTQADKEFWSRIDKLELEQAERQNAKTSAVDTVFDAIGWILFTLFCFN
jgi:hypothetical protein